MTINRDSGRPIRVLMIVPSYYPTVGGMEIQVERLIPFLRDNNVDAAVLTRRPAGEASVECRNGVEIRRKSAAGSPGLRSIAFMMAGVADIVRHRREIDVLHAHSIMSPTTIATVAGVLVRKPRIVTLHATYEPEHLLRKPLGKQRLRLYQRVVSRFVSINADIERLLLTHAIPPSRIVSIPNGIDTVRFSLADGAERRSLRAKLKLPPDQPIVVFAGRLHKVKQIDVLLRAWSGVAGGHLVILGDGDERQPLTELAHELKLDGSVEFRGMEPDVTDYLRAADVFVLPSASEGLSVALLEAMSSGLVPVATAVGGAVDLIRDGDNGRLVRPGDVEGLRMALGQMIASPEWSRAAGLKARESVVADYDLRVIAARLANVYRDSLHESGSRTG